MLLNFLIYLCNLTCAGGKTFQIPSTSSSLLFQDLSLVCRSDGDEIEDMLIQVDPFRENRIRRSCIRVRIFLVILEIIKFINNIIGTTLSQNRGRFC